MGKGPGAGTRAAQVTGGWVRPGGGREGRGVDETPRPGCSEWPFLAQDLTLCVLFSPFCCPSSHLLRGQRQ